MRVLKVLIGCEESQAICKEFRKLGHEAYSCDLKPCSGGHPEWHIQGDVFNAISSKKWDVAIFHPECTYLTVSGLHWNKKNKEREQKTLNAIDFVKKLMACDIKHWAIENPVGCLSSAIRKPNQIIQPYEFGDDASKKTCLWTKNLPLLKTKTHYPARIIQGKKRWGNQDDAGQFRLVVEGKVIGWNDPKMKEYRSKTYPKVAEAIAMQWSEFILNEETIEPAHKPQLALF